MKKSRQTGPGRDYSSAFLVLILIGIIVVVLGLMMAVAHSTARVRIAASRADCRAAQQARFVPLRRFTINADGSIVRQMEQSCRNRV
jgi:flagellar basal body-associated protein FliL